jgi:hypothetical protein
MARSNTTSRRRAARQKSTGKPAGSAPRTASQLGTAAAQAAAIAFAAPQTIAHRTAIGARGLADPSAAAAKEFMRMGSEKLQAVSQVSVAVASGILPIWAKLATLGWEQAQAAAWAALSLAHCRSPQAAAQIQSDYRTGSAERVSAAMAEIVGLGATMTAGSVKAVHDLAVPNARRLGRTALRL